MDSESNPFGRKIVWTVVLKLTRGRSYFTIAGYEPTYYDAGAGSWVSFCSEAQHASAELEEGDDHLKVVFFLGHRGDDE